MKRFSALVLSVVVATPMSIYISGQIPQLPVAHATNSQTTTFTYTGQEETFAVPAGVFSLDVALSGAAGGLASVNNGGNPGLGGYISVSINVTPGDVFKIQVGQQGQGFAPGVQHNIPMAGGWPNGGDGYISPNGNWFGAGGGGSTFLRRVISGTSTLISVAGGGGGAGGLSDGGHGGVTGGGTYSDTTPFTVTREATGGSASSAGQGACSDDGTCSADGAQLDGGDADITYAGGGGGGGRFGGGAGIGFGGGAGGSSWWDSARATATNNQTGVRSGNGILEFTYTPLQLCTPGTYSANGYVPCVNASPGYFVSISGATSQTACPAGTTSTDSASLSCQPIVTTSTSTSTSTTVAPSAPTLAPTQIKPSTCEVKEKQSISRSCYLKNTTLVIPSGAKISLKVIASSSKICKTSGTSLKTLKKGTCAFSLSVTSKKGASKKTTIRIRVN